MKTLASELIKRVPELTVARSASRALENARQNQPHIRQTIAALRSGRGSDGAPSAIVISAGPSVHTQHPAPQILAGGYRGTVVAADGALGYCLRHGLTPDVVVTLDPHPTRVCRWFGDPELASRQDGDDYFRRQDLDPHLRTNELQRNRELIELVDRCGSTLRVAIATSAPPNVTKRCLDVGAQLYWWNPMLDDVDRPASLTRQLYEMNGVPCLATGGNVGTAAWVLAHSVLGKTAVALVGMDFGYPPGTRLEHTQYYTELRELFGNRASEAFISIYNPHLKATWYTDPAYYWYRQSFLQMVPQAACTTYNCTEGGTVFGRGLRSLPLREFLSGVDLSAGEVTRPRRNAGSGAPRRARSA